MKKILLFLIMLFLTACCVKEENITREDRIRDWWNREERPLQYNADGVVDFNIARNITREVFTSIKYEKGTGQFQTRRQTLERKKGGCVDFGILIYMNLRDAGFSDDQIGCIILDNPVPGNSAHAVAVIFLNEDKTEYWPLGYMPDDFILDMGFNLFDMWYYDKKI
jgi:hypothetical protein